MTHTHAHPSATTDGHVLHWAAIYDTMVKIVALGREETLRRRTLELADLKPGQRLVDVGCGTGTLAIAAGRREPRLEIHGIDPASEMVRRARRKAEAAGVDAAFEVGVIEKLPFEDGSIDTITSSLMLHHLPPHTLEAGLAEVSRVLAPGGRFVAVDFAGPGPLLHRLGRLFGRGEAHADHAERIMQQLAQAGFTERTRGQMQPRYLFSVVARKPR